MKRKRSAVLSLLLVSPFLIVSFIIAYYVANRPQNIQSNASGGINSPRNILIGANYTHTSFPNCGLDNTGILLTYDQPASDSKFRVS